MSISINENITLHYIPMEKLKTSSMGVYIHRPLTEEEAAKSGLLPFVLKRGCKMCKTTEEMEKKLDDLYGAELRADVLKKGTDQVLYFGCESISEKYTPFPEPLIDELTELLMSVVLEPVTENGVFLNEYVEQEKKNIIERIESVKNDKRSYAALQCSRQMFKGNKFAISKLGTTEQIKSLTAKELYEHYLNVISTSAIDIYVSGQWDEEKTAENIKKAFSKITFKKGEISTSKPFAGDGEVKKIEESMDIAQGKLSMGFTTETDATDDEYWALMTANSIFGGGAHSKLFNNVREKLSLCYYASSGLDRYTGAIIVNAGIEFENYQKAYDEILAQLKNLQNGDVSELEYVSSINAMVNSLKTCRDDQYAMQSFLLSEKVSGENRSLDFVIDKIQKVTLEEAVEASKKIKLDTVYFLKGEEA